MKKISFYKAMCNDRFEESSGYPVSFRDGNVCVYLVLHKERSLWYATDPVSGLGCGVCSRTRQGLIDAITADKIKVFTNAMRGDSYLKRCDKLRRYAETFPLPILV